MHLCGSLYSVNETTFSAQVQKHLQVQTAAILCWQSLVFHQIFVLNTHTIDNSSGGCDSCMAQLTGHI